MNNAHGRDISNDWDSMREKRSGAAFLRGSPLPLMRISYIYIVRQKYEQAQR
jgi:hypothetical protein